MNMFLESNYRQIISSFIDERKKINPAITYQALADAVRIQKSYLSKVMNGRADFNTDQLFMATRFLDFNKEQSEFLQLLLEYERSVYPERREVLKEEIEKIQEEKRDVKNALGKKIKEMGAGEYDASIYAEYYMEPSIQLVHVMLTIDHFRKNPSEIKEHLNIKEKRFSEILNKLSKMELIQIQDGEIDILERNLHLPKDSKLTFPNQVFLRQRGLERCRELEPSDRTMFMATFSSNPKAIKKLKEKFNEFIQEARELSSKGKSTDCYQLVFDLFPWTESQ